MLIIVKKLDVEEIFEFQINHEVKVSFIIIDDSDNSRFSK